MPAGEMRERIAFEARSGTGAVDAFGNQVAAGNFVEQFRCAARVRPKLGGEQVLAGRLTGKNLVNITVRYSALTASVTPDWRARDTRTGVLYNIHSDVNPDERHEYIEMLAEEGVQT